MTDGSVVKNPQANVGDADLIPGPEDSPRVGNGQPTPVFWTGESHGQRSLEIYTVHGVAKNQTQLSINCVTSQIHACLVDDLKKEKAKTVTKPALVLFLKF